MVEDAGGVVPVKDEFAVGSIRNKIESARPQHGLLMYY